MDTDGRRSPDIRRCRVTPTYEKVLNVEYRRARRFDIETRARGRGVTVPCLLQVRVTSNGGNGEVCSRVNRRLNFDAFHALSNTARYGEKCFSHN